MVIYITGLSIDTKSCAVSCFSTGMKNEEMKHVVWIKYLNFQINKM